MPEPDGLEGLLGEPSTFDDLLLERLKTRQSYKWSAYPADVLPAFVAEMDLPLAPAVKRALRQAVDADDCGYAREDLLPETFAAFAERRWHWQADPSRMILVPDMMAGIARAIELLTIVGEGVVLTPPVYAPFRRAIDRLGRRPIEAPLTRASGGWRLNLESLRTAFEAGGKALILSNPHNPTGYLPSEPELREVAELARRYGVAVISDEVHAPLTLGGRTFTPMLSLGHVRAITVFSASKAWNVMGLKCALMVAGDEETAAALTATPFQMRHPGHLGVVAATAAFEAEMAGESWLETVNAHLQRQHDRASDLFAAALPEVGVARAEAGYLLWLDCRQLGLGDSPADVFLGQGKLALSPGLEFGSQGAGHVRMNIGTGGPLLLEAVLRMHSVRKKERVPPNGSR